MANETNFFSKKLLLWAETTKGVTPTTIAKAYSTTALSFSLIRLRASSYSEDNALSVCSSRAISARDKAARARP